MPGRLADRPLDARVAVQVAIILFLLVLVVLLARQPSVRLLLIPTLALLGWTVLRYQGLGSWIVLVSLMVVRVSIGTGTQTSMHAGIVLIPLFLGLWVAKMFLRRWFGLAPSPMNLPALGLAGAAGLSLIAGNVPWLVFAEMAPLRTQLGALATFVISAAAFLLAANEIRSVKWLKALVWTFIGLGAVYIVSRVIPGYGAISQIFTVGATGSVFWVWLIALAGGQLLFNRDLRLAVRALCAALVLLTLVVGLAPGARDWASGWVPAVVALGMLVWLRWPRGATLLGLVAALVVFINFGLVQRLLLGGDNEYSLFTRGAAWEIVLIIVSANPWLGVGPANYYWYTSMFPILGWYVNFNSHNQYLDLLAQTGLVGLGFFVWFMLAAVRHGWQLRQRLTDGFGSAYVNGALAAVAGCVVAGMLGDWLVPFVYNVGIGGMRASLLMWLFLGGLVALAKFTTSPTPALAVPERTEPRA
jgi:O-antigen ligase